MGVRGGRLKREGVHVHAQLIHLLMQQKPIQHCKVTILYFFKRCLVKEYSPSSTLPETRNQYGLPCGSAGKESTCNVGDLGLMPGLGRSPEDGKGYPLQYSGLENSMDCIVHGVAKSRIRLSDFHFTFTGTRTHGESSSFSGCTVYTIKSKVLPKYSRTKRHGNF